MYERKIKRCNIFLVHTSEKLVQMAEETPAEKEIKKHEGE